MGWLKDIKKQAQNAVNNVIARPLDAINPATALPHLASTLMSGASLAVGGRPDMIERGLGFGNQTPEWDLNEQLQGVGAREASQTYLDAINDQNLDDISKREIFDMWKDGRNAPDLDKKIAEAREGKGIYAVRKVNQSQAKQKIETPGRQQLLAVNRTMGTPNV